MPQPQSHILFKLQKMKKKQYVGQTLRKLMDRCVTHFGNITSSRLDTDIGRHFNTDDHKGLEDVEIHILDFIYQSPHSDYAEKLWNKIERNWMLKLRTQVQYGLNFIDAPNFEIHKVCPKTHMYENNKPRST